MGNDEKPARPTAVSEAALASLEGRVPVPGYDRAAVGVGVVHVGVGGFHRAHQAMYHDRLLDQGAVEWGICGVGVMPADAAMKEALDAQDGLYTLVEKDARGGWTPRVIGSLVRYLFAPDDPEAVIEAMAADSVRIVSLTITEGGYPVDLDSGEFDAGDAAVARDLAPGAVPATAFGLVCAALARRRERGLAPFTVMSCDNLQGNGGVARAAFVGFARALDPELGEWTEREVAFPSSMVDRITPATTDEDRVALGERVGIEDRWPVVCEPFSQWVLEDEFTAGRPPYDRVGVQVVEDVEPFELMKLRLLNGGHQALGFLGILCGHRFVHEAAQDPLLRDFVLGYMRDEAAPTLPPLPGVDPRDYAGGLIERFANPHVADTLARLCAYTSDRIPKFVVPAVRAQLEAGREVRRGATVIAAWARYAEGVDEQGRSIEIVDHRAGEIQARARRRGEDPEAFLADPRLFGPLSDDRRFVDAYVRALRSLDKHGARATLEALVGARRRSVYAGRTA